MSDRIASLSPAMTDAWYNHFYESISWNSKDTTQHFIPFQFHIKLPSPRKARKIIQRDKFGKIEVSHVPKMLL
jgi:hypothetical protein